MSVFDDQMDDWFANDCQGNPSDYDGAGNIGYWAEPDDAPVKVRTEAQKERKRRNRRRPIAKKHAAQRAQAQP